MPSLDGGWLSHFRALVRSVADVPLDPLEFWLSRLDVDSRATYSYYFGRWLAWLRRQQGWGFVSAKDVLVRQIQAEDPYGLLDLLQRFVRKLRGRKATKKKAYTVVRSLFAHNRCLSKPLYSRSACLY